MLLLPCMGEIHTPPRPDAPLRAFHHLFLIPEIPPLCHNMGPTCLSFWTSLRRRFKLVTRWAVSEGAMAPRFSKHILLDFCLFFFLFLSNWAVSYFVFKNQLVLTESRRPPFLPHSVRLQKWKKQSKTSPIRLGWGVGGCMCRLVCRKR